MAADPAEQTDGQQQSGDDGGDEQTPPPADELTAERFDALRSEAVQHRRKARAAEQVADELRAENERLRQQSESDSEKAVREAVEAERERLTAEYATERLQNRLLVRAAGRLADPNDAVLHLSSELDPAVADADIDAAIERLLQSKAYLAASVANGERATLVTQGGRSAPPGDRTEQSADAWLRGRIRS